LLKSITSIAFENLLFLLSSQLISHRPSHPILSEGPHVQMEFPQFPIIYVLTVIKNTLRKESVCVRERERECVTEREQNRERGREREREREKGKKGEKERERQR